MMHLTQTDRWSTPAIECFLLVPELVTPAYVEWLNDPAINRFLESRFAAQNLTSVREFVAIQLADPKTLFLGIRSVALDRHVGNIKLGPIDWQHGLSEIGIMIGDRGAWGQGIGTGAIEVVAQIAQHELGLRKLTAGCYSSNVGSARAFLKAGFEIEGTRPAHFLLDGRPEDLTLLARHLFRIAL